MVNESMSPSYSQIFPDTTPCQRSDYAGKRHFCRNGKSKEGCENTPGQVPLMAQSILEELS
jgi:hypothetical protein